MKIKDVVEKQLGRLPPGVLSGAFKVAKKIPWVRDRLEREYATMLASMETSLRPYRGEFESFGRLPAEGKERAEVLELMKAMCSREESRWREGYVSGAVYHGDRDHIDFLNQVYALYSQANPLHSDLWPSATKYEAEIVAMTAAMLGGGPAAGGDDEEEVCGAVSSGGTESILLAMKTYRDRARAERGIRHPELVVPTTAHAAFDKAARYFNIDLIKVPVGADCKADVAAMSQAISRNTIALVGSAVSFPHGAIDPIEALSELARGQGIGMHVDACLGGFVLPWAERLGYKVPPFDFRLPGVTSMSADTHKYGYAAKGTSVVLYRGHALRRFQYYTTTEWPGGMYFSPTFAGSRPGALSAAAWAAMVSIGERGYLAATRAILETAATIREGIAAIPGLRVLGDPLWVIAFASDELDIYRVMEHMSHGGWNLNGLHKPACVHLCVTLRHTKEGVAERFLADLAAAVDHVRADPSESSGMAPVYGMAATIPVRGVVSDVLERYMDLLYKV
ncbi:MAG: aminotransferase class V-fold PLP-dependent enzyme [Myxococcales bacterium]|nr:aminotransferase class V-fold PLP-dependent enzyme [Myxococcales bacterium]